MWTLWLFTGLLVLGRTLSAYCVGELAMRWCLLRNIGLSSDAVCHDGITSLRRSFTPSEKYPLGGDSQG